jgi:hypothetical protein
VTRSVQLRLTDVGITSLSYVAGAEVVAQDDTQVEFTVQIAPLSPLLVEINTAALEAEQGRGAPDTR